MPDLATQLGHRCPDGFPHVHDGGPQLDPAIGQQGERATGIVRLAFADSDVLVPGGDAESDSVTGPGPGGVFRPVLLEGGLGGVEGRNGTDAACQVVAGDGLVTLDEHVDATQLKGVHAQRQCQFIHQLFHGHGRLVDAVTTERAAEGVVGDHRFPDDVHAGNPVGAAAEDACLVDDARAVAGVRAAVGDDRGVDGHNNPSRSTATR